MTERTFGTNADMIITVSQGIARALKQKYRLAQEPFLVRNMPERLQKDVPKAMVERTNKVGLDCVYVGAVIENRGIERAIGAIAKADKGHRLFIQGPVHPLYKRHLESLVAEHVQGRIIFIDPVPYEQIIESLRRYDIGIYAPEILSDQISFSLPNKLFEYIHAGLGCVVTGNTEVADMVHENNVGCILNETGEKAMALVLDSLDDYDLHQMKAACLVARDQYVWDTDFKKILGPLSSLLKH